MNPIYSTRVTSTGGRDGKVVSEDGVLQVEVRVPKEMGGAGGPYTNPEQLFAAGYAACFDSALNFVARSQKMRIQSNITATVTLNTTESGAFQLSVLLEASIEGVDRDTALTLLEQAHATCPYSRATRNNVDVQVKLL